jgi:hypothetical protein
VSKIEAKNERLSHSWSLSAAGKSVVREPMALPYPRLTLGD